MLFPSPLVEGRLIRRYKRFLADIELASGEIITAHCANPGAMLGLTAPGARVFLSRSDKPSRALPYSWELVEVDFGDGAQWVGINTSLPNHLAAEAIARGGIPALSGYGHLRREVKYGKSSRIDILLEDARRPLCYVEVKNVHLMRQSGLAEFPDCVTARGAKHLEELGDMVDAGHRAVSLFVVQMRAETFTIARDLDPTYALAFRRALERGVEVIAASCRISPDGIELDDEMPVRLP